MSSAQENTGLLEDALEQVLRNATAVHCWHRLRPFYLAATAQQQLEARAILLRRMESDPLSRFMRATFLADVSGDFTFRHQAAALLAMPLCDPDRIAAHLVVAWFEILARQPDRTGFADALRGAGFPALLRRSGACLAADGLAAAAPRAVSQVRKVAIVAPQLSGYSHAPTGLALAHGALLQEQGVAVELFSAQELHIASMPQLIACGNDTNFLPPDPAGWQANQPQALTIHLADQRLSLLRRWRGVADRLNRFDPDLVLFVGLYSPLVDVLYRSRPVVALSVQSVAPVVSADVWLAADPAQAAAAGASWQPEFAAAAPWHYPYRIPPGAALPPLSRAGLDLPDTALVLVSVGYRLREEVGGDWAAHMVDLLAARPDVVWLLVGCGDPLPASLQGLPPGRVRVLPHQANLDGVLACCDIYLNPPRMGGGFSVAQAMAAGLPVLSLGGSDGGDKVGRYAQCDSDSYFATLRHWLDDAGARAERGAVMRTLFRNTLDLRQAGASLMGACQAALASFQRRTTPASS
ncbi:glycosyltransferase [Rugamonas apoptosis]|uniref:Glycosyltransferase family 4 protein n=1 Tax=Rugamonas apoptosis TaxID=2758570 RepID=A0A7W2FBH6_9BURK|nr:glycosyltransferase [Rugamonas apoptosis]MBA5688557.1 glycosyltransferase family 4 protein [Rugamonas apoptosis]